jgi:hypothetical protein
MMHRHRSDTESSWAEKENMLQITIQNIKDHMILITSMIEQLERVLLSRRQKSEKTILSDTVIAADE